MFRRVLSQSRSPPPASAPDKGKPPLPAAAVGRGHWSTESATPPIRALGRRVGDHRCGTSRAHGRGNGPRFVVRADTPASVPAPSGRPPPVPIRLRSEEHTSELQSLRHLVCRLLLEKNKNFSQLSGV